MRVSIFSLLLSISFLTFSAQASMVVPGGETKSVSGIDVPLSVQIVTPDTQDELALLGAGLRRKKVALAKIKIYVAQLYSSQPELYVRTNDGAAPSIGNMKSSSIVLTFKRNVDSQTMKDAFEEALAVNNVDVFQPHIADLMNAVLNGSPAIEGKSYAFYGVKVSDSVDKIIFEDSASNQVILLGPTGFIKDVMSMWVGKVENPLLQELKDKLVSGE